MNLKVVVKEKINEIIRYLERYIKIISGMSLCTVLILYSKVTPNIFIIDLLILIACLILLFVVLEVFSEMLKSFIDTFLRNQYDYQTNHILEMYRRWRKETDDTDAKDELMNFF